MNPESSLATLLATLPQRGAVQWIGVRPARLATVQSLDSVHVTIDQGLEGDRYSGRSRKRHVTLIQHEHLAAIASLLHKQNVDPGVLWRNISISGMLTLIDV